MPSATAEISNLIKLQTEGKSTLLDQAKDATGLFNGMKGFGEKMANVILKATLNSALEAKLSGNPYKANQILDNLKSYSAAYGVSDRDFAKVVESSKNTQTADSVPDAKKKLAQLNKDLDIAVFSADKPIGRSFRSAGIIFSLPGNVLKLWWKNCCV